MILSEEIIGAAARAILTSRGFVLSSCDDAFEDARAAIAAVLPDIEKAVREKCAQVADLAATTWTLDGEIWAAHRIAARIRALPSSTEDDAGSRAACGEAAAPIWCGETANPHKGRYRKKPIVIDAMRWTGANRVEVARFIVGDSLSMDHTLLLPGNAVFIETREGVMRADIGDWIIKGAKGEFYPCKPDIFAETYSREAAAPPDYQKLSNDLLFAIKADVETIDSLTRENEAKDKALAFKQRELDACEGALRNSGNVVQTLYDDKKALHRENEAMREALKPFVIAAPLLNNIDFQRARRALSSEISPHDRHNHHQP